MQLVGSGKWGWRAAAVAIWLAGMEVAGEQSTMKQISRDELCVTEGAVEEGANHRLLVNVPKMRAYLNEVTPQTVEARITYEGKTEKEIALGSGEMRRQFGLKLRAGDACNLVYAMWRIEPESKLVVSVKSNPGEHSSAECGNRGYKNIKASKSRPVPQLRVGERHVMRAEMSGDQLRVMVDGAAVWEGSVGADGGGMQGPVGIRSDNARVEIELGVAEGVGGKRVGCKTGADVAE